MKNSFIKSVFALVAVVVIASTSFSTVQGYGSSHSGSRVKRVVTPAPLVLGEATTTPACSGMYLTEYMRKGMTNNAEQVKKLQTFLTEQGFATPVTGFFGDITESSVKSFQTKNAADILTPWKLTEPTGYVFKTTRAKINNIKCAGSEVMPTI